MLRISLNAIPQDILPYREDGSAEPIDPSSGPLGVELGAALTHQGFTVSW